LRSVLPLRLLRSFHLVVKPTEGVRFRSCLPLSCPCQDPTFFAPRAFPDGHRPRHGFCLSLHRRTPCPLKSCHPPRFFVTNALFGKAICFEFNPSTPASCYLPRCPATRPFFSRTSGVLPPPLVPLLWLVNAPRPLPCRLLSSLCAFAPLHSPISPDLFSAFLPL